MTYKKTRMKSPILAKSQEHAAILKKMRKAHLSHIRKIRDVGFLPEGRNSFTLNRLNPL